MEWKTTTDTAIKYTSEAIYAFVKAILGVSVGGLFAFYMVLSAAGIHAEVMRGEYIDAGMGGHRFRHLGFGVRVLRERNSERKRPVAS